MSNKEAMSTTHSKNKKIENNYSIFLSLSKVPSDGNKTTSTGFEPTHFSSLKKLAKQWQKYSICSAIFSQMMRWDQYKERWKWDFRRRIHNISFIGNTFIYDFDDGDISMKQFIKIYKNKFSFLIIESKNNYKYDYDRFKVLVVHDSFFVHPYNTDVVPEGLNRKVITQYRSLYIGFATQYDFWKYADHSTTDENRLASNTGKEFRVCK